MRRVIAVRLSGWGTSGDSRLVWLISGTRTPRCRSGRLAVAFHSEFGNWSGARDLTRGLTVPNRVSDVSSSILAAPQVSARIDCCLLLVLPGPRRLTL